MAFREPTLYVLATVIHLLSPWVAGAKSQNQIKCLETGRFYRDPDRPQHKIWTTSECSKYFLCLEGEVFDFKCSPGLLFDIHKQICDSNSKIDNCDITSASETSNLGGKCANGTHLGCQDGTCLPRQFFCDGSTDCADGSDELSCDPNNDQNSATFCNPSTCMPPHCLCSSDGTQTPFGLDPAQIPQMIVVTFDGAINYENWELYDKVLFKGRTNPNGCPIKSTFFVNHQYNNYHQTQQLWNQGHEIGVHSITHRSPEEWWSRNATIEDWFDEMVGQANVLHKFAKIRMSDVRGLRVPFLGVGWNRQFLMMQEFGFVYDSSVIAPFSNPPLWPYTLDHTIPHSCSHVKQNCPTRSYPGIWEMVINPLETNTYSCPLLDSCSDELTGDEVYKMLIHNFNRHYLTNRAPFGLHIHSRWFKKKENVDAFQDFVAKVLQQKDVWFVTNSQAISWMQNPALTSELISFGAWGCGKLFAQSEIACNLPNVCKLYSKIFQQDRYLYTCALCPKHYPWIRNEFGLN